MRTVTPVITTVPRVLTDPRSLSVLLRPRNDDPQLPDSTQRSIGPTGQDERHRAGLPTPCAGRDVRRLLGHLVAEHA